MFRLLFPGFQKFRPTVLGRVTHGHHLRADRVDGALQRLQLVRAQLLHRHRRLHLRSRLKLFFLGNPNYKIFVNLARPMSLCSMVLDLSLKYIQQGAKRKVLTRKVRKRKFLTREVLARKVLNI